MKRRIASDHAFGGNLKRRSSSLFSIATIDEGAMTPLGASSRPTSYVSLAEKKGLIPSHQRSVSLASAYATETEVSDASDGGLFIEDEELCNDQLEKRKTPIVFTGLEGLALEATTLLRVESKAAQELIALRTGLVFEPGEQHFDRHNRLHKERPLRVSSIMDHLSKCGVQARCQQVTNRPEELFLEDEDYLRAHLPGYMKRLDKLAHCSCCDRLDREAEQFKSIYFTIDSVKEAKAAATSLCRLVSRVVEGELDNGFALIRPPGHHAEPGLAGGYCVINNVAVAAAYSRAKLGVEKILIVDWDVHHGNGTQSIFLENPNVLYFSVHRWQGGNFYPFMQNGGPTNVGMNDGAGYNINVGWSMKGMGDEEYLAVWERVLMPVAKEYDPDLVLVSAGFDAALGDMGECKVTPECFGRLIRCLMTLANGKVVCTLEGGYVRSVLGKCVETVLKSLLDPNSAMVSKKECQQDKDDRDGADVLDLIDRCAAKNIRSTIAAHQSYWTCFQ